MVSNEQTAFGRFEADALQRLNAYYLHTNQIIGVTGFGFGLACAGLALPPLYVIASMVFLLIVWGDGLARYKRHLSALRAIHSPHVRWYVILWRARIALLGWLFLAYVGFGGVGTHIALHP